MINALIIDDEAGSRNNLIYLVEKYCPDVKIIGWAEEAVSGLALINAKKPDLIFLDIEMPELDGFQLLEQLPAKINPKIIFTTAYEQYAIQAIKVSALDYLLKPIDIEELKDTIQRYKQAMRAEKNSTLTWLNTNGTGRPKKMVVPHKGGITFLEENDIIYLEAKRNYTEIFIKDHAPLLVAKSLGDFEQLLSSSPRFFRTHRSFIINLNFLEHWISKDGGYLMMINEMQVPISRTRKENLFELIQKP